MNAEWRINCILCVEYIQCSNAPCIIHKQKCMIHYGSPNVDDLCAPVGAINEKNMRIHSSNLEIFNGWLLTASSKFYANVHTGKDQNTFLLL